ncbi:MAG: hypothetical protein K0S12_290 [Bacteroidetes bacterium]|nr:hypothetical protein [Bacteroidota bacterium]
MNYEFPPNNDIGGRRWSKFSKHLAKKGYEIHVICTEYHTSAVSSWEKDIALPNVIRHVLPLNYPKVFISHDGSLPNKIRFRLLKLYYNLKTKKRIYDRTFLWEKQFISKADELIKKHSIKNIVVTGAPFYLMYYAALLAKQHPGLNLIGDYRDPWIGAKNFGLGNLSPSHLKFETEVQNTVAEEFSYITAPNKFLLNSIKESITVKPKCDFVELTHAYDPDDLKESNTVFTKSDTIRFVYGGAIYMGLDKYLVKLNETLTKLKAEKPELYKRLRFDFYTPDVNTLQVLAAHPEVVSAHQPVGEKIFARIKEADFCMIMLASQNKNFLTTKSIEFLTLNKPFFYLGENGYVSEFIEKNKLGFSVNENKPLTEQLVSLTEHYLSDQFHYNNQFDFSQYSLEKVGSKVEELLK